MILVLDLPTEVETELRRAASVRGVAVEDYAVERLRDPLSAADYLWARLCEVQTHKFGPSSMSEARQRQRQREFYATPEGQAELADWRALGR